MPKIFIPDGYVNFTVRFNRSAQAADKFSSFSLAAKRGTGDPDMGAMLGQFIHGWTETGSLNEYQPSDVFARNLNILFKAGGLLFSQDVPDPWAAGGGSGQLCSPAVSTTIKKHTALAGRKFRGRFQIPWAGEDDVDEAGVIGGTPLEAINLAAGVFLDTLNDDATLLNGVYLLHDSPATAPTLISSLTCRETVGTVRKRQQVGS